MKNKIFISSLTSLLLVQGFSADESKLEDLYITTATKTEKNIDGVSASVVVITKEDMQKISATNVGDALRKVPSLNIQMGRFPHPSSASKGSISIRGVGPNGTLILLDGKRLSGETEQPYELDRIPVSMIERIEIVKGSMSTLYGSDAIGGVINIITKKNIDINQSDLDIKYGQNNHADARQRVINLSTMGSLDGYKYKLYGSLTDNSSFRLDRNYTQMVPVNPAHPQHGKQGTLGVTYLDDATVGSIGASLEKDITNSFTMGVDLNYFKENREGEYLGVSPMTGNPAPVQNTPVFSKDKNNRFDYSVFARYDITDELSTTLRYYKSDYEKRNETTPMNFAGPINTKFSANVEVDTIESVTTYALNDANLLTLGLDFRKEKRDSSAINPDPTSSDFITKKVEYKAAYLQDEIEFSDTLNATVGIRYDDISNASSKTTFQGGVVYRLDENNKIRANFATGYRAPDIAEYFVVSPLFKDAKRYGSEVINTIKTTAYNLKPEESKTYELAYSNSFNGLNSELVLFRTEVKDKIDLVSYGAGANKYYTSENLEKVNINGVELNFDYMLNKNFDAGLNLTYLKTKDKQTSKEIIYTPNISAALNLTYKPIEPLQTNLNVRYIGRQYEDVLNRDKVSGYSLVDVGASYELNKTFSVYGGVDNIFDKKVDTNIDINVGTFYFAGFRIKI